MDYAVREAYYCGWYGRLLYQREGLLQMVEEEMRGGLSWVILGCGLLHQEGGLLYE